MLTPLDILSAVDFADGSRRHVDYQLAANFFDTSWAEATEAHGAIKDITTDGTKLFYNREEGPLYFVLPQNVPEFTGDVRAVIALVERVAPECYPGVQKGIHGWYGELTYDKPKRDKNGKACAMMSRRNDHATPELALLSAFLCYVTAYPTKSHPAPDAG